MTAAIGHGEAQPLGATWDGGGVNFALYSAHAERVELCLFSADGAREQRRIVLPVHTDGVWHGRVDGCAPGTLYGYRVHGPYAPEAGHRFNPNKLLVDPYARMLRGELRWSDANYGFRRGDPRQDLSFDTRDNAECVPKCVVVDPAFDWGDERPPRVPASETVIYETHVRGFTMRHPGVPRALRGTYAGLAHPRVLAYLKDLGVTSVELMPVHAFVDDHVLVARGLRNFWGYNTLAYFAPEGRYLASGSAAEFQAMVRALHDAGIEVILDVVYNHTAEGNHLGPTLSLRGIDNASYYRLQPQRPSRYQDFSGCGNTLNLDHPRVRALVLDSLRYWVTHMHVDGFRFDLAPILGRADGHFDADAPLFRDLREDPALRRVKLIAEPWDLGPDGYRLGGFPVGWHEWNDAFRDAVRRFWHGDEDVTPELARRLHGSGDLFEHAGRAPWCSVNFVTSHDGFTLADVVSYRERHNAANAEGNRDGHEANFSCNHGVEGPSDDGDVRSRRVRQRRNLMATLLLAQGTPMMLAGDELGRTQHGNNNAYCQDNETAWVDWSRLDVEREFHGFVRRLLRLRAEHPVLRRDHYVHGDGDVAAGGFADIEWLRPDAQPMTAADWHGEHRDCFAMLLAGTFATQARAVVEDVVLIVVNRGAEDVHFRLPRRGGVQQWRELLTTTGEAAAGVVDAVAAPARSVCVLAPQDEEAAS